MIPADRERVLTAADALELLAGLSILVNAFERHNPSGLSRSQGEALAKARALVEKMGGAVVDALPLSVCEPTDAKAIAGAKVMVIELDRMFAEAHGHGFLYENEFRALRAVLADIACVGPAVEDSTLPATPNVEAGDSFLYAVVAAAEKQRPSYIMDPAAWLNGFSSGWLACRAIAPEDVFAGDNSPVSAKGGGE